MRFTRDEIRVLDIFLSEKINRGGSRNLSQIKDPDNELKYIDCYDLVNKLNSLSNDRDQDIEYYKINIIPKIDKTILLEDDYLKELDDFVLDSSLSSESFTAKRLHVIGFIKGLNFVKDLLTSNPENV